MPIHDQGYRRYAGGRGPGGRAWTVIAKTGIRTLLRKRAFIGLLLLAWIPFLVRAVQIYAAANLPQAAFLAPTPLLFRQFLEQQEIFLFFVTIYAGAGLIANDRRANSLQIYLSKPLTRFEYIVGKLVILMTFLLLVTWLPAVVLLIVQILFTGSFDFFTANLHLFPAITLFSIIQVLIVGSTMLALSSLSKSSRYVGVLYAALIFLTEAMYGVLYAVTRDSSIAWMSMRFSLGQVGDFLFRLPLRYDTPVAVSFLAIGVLGALSLVVLDRRVRGVEVVA